MLLPQQGPSLHGVRPMLTMHCNLRPLSHQFRVDGKSVNPVSQQRIRLIETAVAG